MILDTDLLLVAERLGGALDRLEKIETDLQTQALPIQGAAAAQASCRVAATSGSPPVGCQMALKRGRPFTATSR
jgi:hypothetical protein